MRFEFGKVPDVPIQYLYIGHTLGIWAQMTKKRAAFKTTYTKEFGGKKKKRPTHTQKKRWLNSITIVESLKRLVLKYVRKIRKIIMWLRVQPIVCAQ